MHHTMPPKLQRTACGDMCVVVGALDPKIRYVGRVERRASGIVRYDWAGVTIRTRVKGGGNFCVLMNGGGNYFEVRMNGILCSLLCTSYDTREYCLLAELPVDKVALIEIVKRTEPVVQTIITSSRPVEVVCFYISQSTQLLNPDQGRPTRRLEFIGNSDTTGFGVEGEKSGGFSFWSLDPATSNIARSFAWLTSAYFGAEGSYCAYSGKAVNTNPLLDLFGYTIADLYPRTLASEKNLVHDFRQDPWVPDAVIILAGANDFFTYPRPNPEAFLGSYIMLIKVIQRARPRTPVMCVTLSPHVLNDSDDKMHGYAELLRYLVGRAVACVGEPTLVQHIHLDPEPMDPDRDWGSMQHWGPSGHKKVANVLLPAVSQLLGWGHGGTVVPGAKMAMQTAVKVSQEPRVGGETPMQVHTQPPAGRKSIMEVHRGTIGYNDEMGSEPPPAPTPTPATTTSTTTTAPTPVLTGASHGQSQVLLQRSESSSPSHHSYGNSPILTSGVGGAAASPTSFAKESAVSRARSGVMLDIPETHTDNNNGSTTSVLSNNEFSYRPAYQSSTNILDQSDSENPEPANQEDSPKKHAPFGGLSPSLIGGSSPSGWEGGSNKPLFSPVQSDSSPLPQKASTPVLSPVIPVAATPEIRSGEDSDDTAYRKDANSSRGEPSKISNQSAPSSLFPPSPPAAHGFFTPADAYKTPENVNKDGGKSKENEEDGEFSDAEEDFEDSQIDREEDGSDVDVRRAFKERKRNGEMDDEGHTVYAGESEDEDGEGHLRMDGLSVY